MAILCEILTAIDAVYSPFLLAAYNKKQVLALLWWCTGQTPDEQLPALNMEKCKELFVNMYEIQGKPNR